MKMFYDFNEVLSLPSGRVSFVPEFGNFFELGSVHLIICIVSLKTSFLFDSMSIVVEISLFSVFISCCLVVSFLISVRNLLLFSKLIRFSFRLIGQYTTSFVASSTVIS